MKTFRDDSAEIQNVINDYFEGIYNGNIEQLRGAFYQDCLLFGDINGQPYFKKLDEYIEGVKHRKSPHELGEEFRMEILSIETLGNNAVVKLHVPMLGFNYYDFLSLSKLNGKWLIVNKLFTNVR
ncbi:MAG: nuclear transport factor 2 family protein [Spirosomataceae bacterium]